MKKYHLATLVASTATQDDVINLNQSRLHCFYCRVRHCKSVLLHCTTHPPLSDFIVSAADSTRGKRRMPSETV
jgi:hypothetical protein